MRINKFVALASGLSRRAADAAIEQSRVSVNGQPPTPGHDVAESDAVALDGRPLFAPVQLTTIMLNKPPGFVVSRDGQGAETIYSLLPETMHGLKPIGRLDKDSSGLLLLTNDGHLAQQLTHPSYRKRKTYEIGLDAPLQPLHRQMVADHGIQLDDGPSKLELERLQDGDDTKWRVQMYEGRNRQIRRTFEALGYKVTQLHRTHFGQYELGSLRSGSIQKIS
jgi:23S rRNA pseudouridine2605 synthase